MSRRFRLWEKKRGDRRTGSKLVGTAGEGIIFAALFLLGSISLAALVTTELIRGENVGQWNIWLWLSLVVLAILILIGAGGLIYTILLIRTTAEHRRALAKRATNIDLLAETLTLTQRLSNGSARRQPDKQPRDQTRLSTAHHPLTRLAIAGGRCFQSRLERVGLLAACAGRGQASGGRA